MSRREAGGCEGAISRARGEGRGWQAGGEVQLGRAGARTVVKNASCTAADASCEQEGARAGGAALSTTATRTRRAALAERRRPGSAAAAAGANVDSAARPPPGATAFPGGANACTRPRSQPGRNVRRGHERVATRRPPGCTHRIGTTHVPSCTALAIHACPAQRSSGTGSWFGTGMGVRQRSGPLGGAHPVNRSQLNRRLELDARSRPMSCAICALFGQRPGDGHHQRVSCGTRALKLKPPTGRDIVQAPEAFSRAQS